MLIRTNHHTGERERRGRSVRGAAAIALVCSVLAHGLILWGLSSAIWDAAAAGSTAIDEQPPRRVYVSFNKPAPAPAPPRADQRSPEQQSPAPIELHAVLPDIGSPAISSDDPIDLSGALFPSIDPGALYTKAMDPIDPMDPLDDAMPDIGFAGLGASNARSVVYVVDASGPMVGTLPIVINELERSVLTLDPAQTFQVIFINKNGLDLGFAIAPLSDGLIRALPEQTRQVIRWCRTIQATGPSEPLPALERALALRPDAVFLFSRVSSYIGAYEQNREQRLDAERTAAMSRLDQLNPRSGEANLRRTAIKVVQFHEQDPSGLFRAIAREHGGEGTGEPYRFITREDGSFR